MKVKFTILGEPAGKGRPRFRSMGPYVKTYTPEKTVTYENLVKLEYRRQCSDFRFEDSAPLDMRITAYYSIPKSASKKKRAQMERFEIRPMKKPDNDNIVNVSIECEDCDAVLFDITESDLEDDGSGDYEYEAPEADEEVE